MKTIKLIRLYADGFRGQEFDITFGDHDTIISADNGKGKTTCYDALLWLLLGVDSADDTNRNLFDNRTPDDPDNPKTADVEGHLTTDVEPIALRKIAEQTWKYDKSADVPKLVRVADTYRHFINGNEVTATEYKQFITDTFGRADGYLKLMLNPRFWEMLDARSLRKYFASMAGEIKDSDLKGDYNEVLADIKNLGVEKALKNYRDRYKEFDKLTATAKSKLKDAKAEMPTIANLESVESEIANLESEKRGLEAIRESLTGHNESIIAKRKAEEDAIAAKRAEIAQAEIDYNVAQTEKERKLVAELDTAKENNASVNRRIKSVEGEIDDLKPRLSTEDARIKEMRAELKAILLRTFDGVCENCGASFVGAERAKRLEQFRIKKEADRVAKIAEGQAQEAKIAKLTTQLADAETRLNGIERVNVRPIEDALIEFRKNRKAWIATEEYARLMRELDALERDRTEIPTNEELTDIQVRVGEIDAKLKGLYMNLGIKRNAQEQSLAKVEQLTNTIAGFKTESAKARKHEAQVLEYQREYAEIVRKRVNANFRNVSVEMTAPNKSGGLEDVCKLRLDGVADTCNYANRIKIGIEVAQVFQKHFGVCLPLWIDNAESITEVPEHDGQRVMLVVRSGRPLTVEYDENWKVYLAQREAEEQAISEQRKLEKARQQIAVEYMLNDFSKKLQ